MKTRYPINYGLEGRPFSSISKYLVASVTSRELKNNLGKFEYRVDEGIFLKYSSKRKTQRCHNKRIGKIVESVDVKLDEGVEFLTTNEVDYPTYDEMIEEDEHELSKEK